MGDTRHIHCGIPRITHRRYRVHTFWHTSYCLWVICSVCSLVRLVSPMGDMMRIHGSIPWIAHKRYGGSYTLTHLVSPMSRLRCIHCCLPLIRRLLPQAWKHDLILISFSIPFSNSLFELSSRLQLWTSNSLSILVYSQTPESTSMLAPTSISTSNSHLQLQLFELNLDIFDFKISTSTNFELTSNFDFKFDFI